MRLENDIRIFERHNIEYLHIDVMDGLFVPNYALGADFVKTVKNSTSIPLDIHLMIDRPEDKIGWFAFGAGDFISFHFEASRDPGKAARKIRERGGKAMMALSPATPIRVLSDFIDDLDDVLIMTVYPGFAGQKLAVGALDKIMRLRLAYPLIEIEVDGNVSFENAARMRGAGADIFVAGSSSVFSKSDDLAGNIYKLRACIK
jgi:ribulose-phosphate 3-epimerase